MSHTDELRRDLSALKLIATRTNPTPMSFGATCPR